ncbi:hypothetical protein [Encephalitozoon cuniculi GB-M1]|uniref:PDEase domain-containing protein n=2 Tax=Encephalitozoon cuniculi TaxID=6035 RepID=Q8STT1_ENCCU|nr:uncharacterized protein ECU09_0790 [Encephalitozoon cuniculi GB-M1]AGE96440.1 hypothetical protein [Encephalitozoon cuniculi]KMV65442.1 hypothetical protein M970_090800 [Encephalitozoon cuniculi EcunIII-L]UYI26764.1 cGMP-dependent 3',5'-cyclic phosphodiesterase [Encephalitozoon cuniculi]CAD27052.1 hypothetical protein [Encephalitozoon cuniculi GB-M1]
MIDQGKEVSKDIRDAIVKTIQNKKNFCSRPTGDLRLSLSSYRLFHLENISLADGVATAMETLVKDPRFHLLGIRPETLSSFFSFSFFHMLPQRYHNLDHLVNTLCFGDFILQRLGEGGYTLPILDKMCLMIALGLHDIGHPGERNRGKIGALSSSYGGPKAISFELIHASICRKMVSAYRHTLFAGLDDAETERRQGFIEKMIFATDLKLNAEIIGAFDAKYFEKETQGSMERRVRNGVGGEISEIELMMIMKIADLSSCYKDYRIFNKNSIAFWAEVYDDDDYNRTLENISEDIDLLEGISIPLADSFSLVFGDLRFLYDQALANLREHRKYYRRLKAQGSPKHPLAGE